MVVETIKDVNAEMINVSISTPYNLIASKLSR